MPPLAEAYVRLRPDTTGFSAEAKAKIEANPPVAHGKIDLDSGGAREQIAVVKQELRGVDGKTATARLDVNSGPALRSIGLVAAALAAVVGIGAGLGAAVGLGAIAGAGIGAAVAGLSGIGGAVKALGDATKGAGAAASHAAGQQLALAGAMDQVRSAQASLKNTLASAADAERHSAEQVTAAQKDVTAARAAAVATIRDLVVQQAALARQQEDAARAQEDFALQQRGALLDITQARLDLNKVLIDPHATQLQRAQAQLAYDEAVQHNKDLKTQAKDLAASNVDLTKRAKDLAAQKAAADKAGVAGSAQVVAAQQRLTDAVANAAATQRQDAYQIVQAQQAVVSAQRAVQAASVSAGTAGAAATDKLAESMKNLSPAGQGFARFLRGFIDGPIRQLRMATQTGLLPGLQAGLASLAPIIQKNLPAFQAFARVLGQALGGLITTAGKLTAPFVKLATVALKALAPLEGVFTAFADAFGRMVAQIVADGSLQKSMDAVVKLFAALLPILPPLLPPLINLATTILPPLAEALKALLPALVALAVALGPALIGALKIVTPMLQWFGDFCRDHPSVVRDLAVAILAVVAAVKLWSLWQAILDITLGGFPIVAIAIGIAAIGIAAVWALNHFKSFGAFAVRIFGDVNAAAQAVWRWIRDRWNSLYSWLTLPFAAASTWIVARWNGIVDFFKKLPGRLAAVGAHMFDFMKIAFNAAITWIRDRWTDLFNWLTGVSIDAPIGLIVSGIVASSGHPTQRVQVPHLATGAIIRARPGGTTATIGEGGQDEAVTPLGGPGGLEEAVFQAMRRALADAELRLERRGAEVLARIVRAGNLSLGGL